MNPADESTNGKSQSLRLTFDGGTLVVEGLAAEQEPDAAGRPVRSAHAPVPR